MQLDSVEINTEMIREKYLQILKRIAESARSVGRLPEDVRVVVVTKTHPVEVIQLLIDVGVVDFGENYTEEAIPKIETLSMKEKLQWHMIGHVQSRKAQDVCEHFQYLHSLDSVKLAKRLSRFALMLDRILPVWLEFNISGEESKYGWSITAEENWSRILPEIEIILALTNLNVLGVMTVPPYSENPESSRPIYRKLREFQEFVIKQLKLPGFRESSMGMSSDFEVAIQEGSTCVRIGQAILGSRPG